MIACRYFRAVRRGLGRVPSWPRPRSNLAGLVSGGLEALALPTGRMKRDASRVPKVRFGSQTAGRRRHAPRPISGLIRHTASAEGMPGNSHDRRFRRGYADMLGPVRALLPPTCLYPVPDAGMFEGWLHGNPMAYGPPFDCPAISCAARTPDWYAPWQVPCPP